MTLPIIEKRNYIRNGSLVYNCKDDSSNNIRCITINNINGMKKSTRYIVSFKMRVLSGNIVYILVKKVVNHTANEIYIDGIKKFGFDNSNVVLPPSVNGTGGDPINDGNFHEFKLKFTTADSPELIPGQYTDAGCLGDVFVLNQGSNTKCTVEITDLKWEMDNGTPTAWTRAPEDLISPFEVIEFYSKEETDKLLEGKANVEDVYTKVETDNLLDKKANDADVYKKSETYSKQETDSLLDDKANTEDVYSAAQTDNLLSAKANIANTYSKKEVEALIQGITGGEGSSGVVYTKSETDDLIYGLHNQRNLLLEEWLTFQDNPDSEYFILDKSQYTSDGILRYVKGGGSSGVIYINNIIAMEPNTDYVVSFKAKFVNGDSSTFAVRTGVNHQYTEFLFDGVSKGEFTQDPTHYGGLANIGFAGTEFHEFILKFKTADKIAPKANVFGTFFNGDVIAFADNSSETFSIEFKDLKWEKGVSPKPWNPPLKLSEFYLKSDIDDMIYGLSKNKNLLRVEWLTVADGGASNSFGLDKTRYLSEGVVIYNKPTSSVGKISIDNTSAMRPNTKYVISFKARRTDQRSGNINVAVRKYLNHKETEWYFDGTLMGPFEEDVSSMGSGFKNIDMCGQFHEFVLKFTTNSNISLTSSYPGYPGDLIAFDDNSSISYRVEFKDFKWEEGTIPSRWSPPLEVDKEYLEAELNKYLPLVGGTITGNLTLKGTGNYGNKLNFGDGDIVHLHEVSDDTLEIKATRVNLTNSIGGTTVQVTGNKATYNGNELLTVAGGTITGNLTLKGSNSYGNKLNFGDGDYVHLHEISDDTLEIKATRVNLTNGDGGTTLQVANNKATYNGNEILTVIGGTVTSLAITNSLELSNSDNNKQLKIQNGLITYNRNNVNYTLLDFGSSIPRFGSISKTLYLDGLGENIIYTYKNENNSYTTKRIALVENVETQTTGKISEALKSIGSSNIFMNSSTYVDDILAAIRERATSNKYNITVDQLNTKLIDTGTYFCNGFITNLSGASVFNDKSMVVVHTSRSESNTNLFFSKQVAYDVYSQSTAGRKVSRFLMYTFNGTECTVTAIKDWSSSDIVAFDYEITQIKSMLTDIANIKTVNNTQNTNITNITNKLTNFLSQVFTVSITTNNFNTATTSGTTFCVSHKGITTFNGQFVFLSTYAAAYNSAITVGTIADTKFRPKHAVVFNDVPVFNVLVSNENQYIGHCNILISTAGVITVVAGSLTCAVQSGRWIRMSGCSFPNCMTIADF